MNSFDLVKYWSQNKEKTILKRYSKKSISIMQVLAIIMIARFSCTALSNIKIFSMTFIFIYGVLFIACFTLQYGTITRQEMYMLILILGYTLFVVFKTQEDGLFNTQAFNAYILVFFYFIYLYMKRINRKKVIVLSMTSLLGLLFTYIYSIFMLIKDPTLSRKSAGAIVESNSVDLLNAVGGFDTVYGSLIVLIFLIYLSKETADRKFRLLINIIIVCICIFIVFASFGTALTLLVILLALILFKKNWKFGIIVGGSIIVVLVYREEIGTFIYNLSDYITGFDILRNKIKDIAYILITGESTGTLAGDDGRLARMEWSFQTFLKYPLLGGYGKSDVQIGQHSELIDNFARFGIVGAGLIINFFIYFFKYNIKMTTSELGHKCYWVAIIIYIAVSILNPSLYTQQVMPFFVLLPFFDSFDINDVN